MESTTPQDTSCLSRFRFGQSASEKEETQQPQPAMRIERAGVGLSRGSSAPASKWTALNAPIRLGLVCAMLLVPPSPCEPAAGAFTSQSRIAARPGLFSARACPRSFCRAPSSCPVLQSGRELLEYGGQVAGLDETLAVLQLKEKRDKYLATRSAGQGTVSGDSSGGAAEGDDDWLARVSDAEMLRLLRARRKNVYGHDWLLQVGTSDPLHENIDFFDWQLPPFDVFGCEQGEDGKAAMVQSAWELALAHSQWRTALKMPAVVAPQCETTVPFVSETDHVERVQGFVGLVSSRVAWLDAASIPLQDRAAGERKGEPVTEQMLWVRMPNAQGKEGTKGEICAVLAEAAVACAWANARQGIGVTKQARLLLDLSQVDDGVAWLTVALVWRLVTLPRLRAMCLQLLNPVEVASHPVPSVLPLDQFPGLFNSIHVLVPPGGVGVVQGPALVECVGVRLMEPGWGLVSTLADAIPLIDMMAAAWLLNSDTRTKIVFEAAASSTLRSRVDAVASAAATAVVNAPPIRMALMSDIICRFAARC